MCKAIDAPSFKYLIRIVKSLASQGELTVTNLAMASRMNHKRCSSVLEWLVKTGMTQKRISGKKRYFALTHRGWEFLDHAEKMGSIAHSPVIIT
jgi:predicted transcriptional regulator